MSAHRSLLALSAAWAGARLCGEVGVRLRQPRVIGEIIAGILLGPTGIGPEASEALFPSILAVPALRTVASLGPTLYIFSVGLDFDVRSLLPVKGQVMALAALSTALPSSAAIGVAAVLKQMNGFLGKSGSMTSFTLALASAFACSALPVAALILQELGLFDTPNAKVCIGAAALVTVLQFILLALAEATSVDPDPIAVLVAACRAIGGTAGLVVAQIGCSYLFSRLRRSFPALLGGDPGPMICILIYVLVVLSAIATDLLGFTVVLGGFTAGCSIPFDMRLRARLKEPFKLLNSWLLLPVFFVVSGLATNLRLVTAEMLPGILLVVVSAIGSKLVVTFFAPWIRQRWVTAIQLNCLLNCRGLLVLVINLQADSLGLFGKGTSAALVIMALVSTAMTGPLVRKLVAIDTNRDPPQDGLQVEAKHEDEPAVGTQHI